jgi:hypothetical protein
MPPNVNGPPGHACVLNTAIPKLDNTSNNTGIHELPVRLNDTAAAAAPIVKATLPRIANKGAGAPPRIGCFQTASIAGCQAFGALEL